MTGDTHNFGRRVEIVGDRVRKPRTIRWERLLLDRASPLRACLREVGRASALGEAAFEFLPSLAFEPHADGPGGDVERIDLAPLGAIDAVERRELASIAGRAIALFSWLGLADLHWENLALGRNGAGRIVFGPLDVELVLDDLARPTETKLLPDADPEYAALCRHAAGVRRLLPWLGKPVDPGDLAWIVAGYDRALTLLDASSAAIAAAIASVPGVREAPIRVLLRATGEYAPNRLRDAWPPLLEAEREQLARGDVPYFFRTLGRDGLFHYADASLRTAHRLPSEGDVPELAPLLSLERGLRSKRRARLHDEGVFTIVGAFDDRRFEGTFEADGAAITFARRAVVVRRDGGDELETARNLGAFVGSVYLPCVCGEVEGAIAANPSRCENRDQSRLFSRLQRRPPRRGR